MKSEGNDGSALVTEGTPGPGSGRPPPRKRTATLQGLAVPGAEDVPSLSPTADAPPSLEALDSALGFSAAPSPPVSARAPHLSPPSAPPRPRQSALPPPPNNAPAAGAPPASSAPPEPALSAENDGSIAEDDSSSTTRDSGPGALGARRRSRRTVKIPNDAVPGATPAPPAVSSTPAPGAATASPPSTPPPAAASSSASDSSSHVAGTGAPALAQQATATPPPAAPPRERGPIVTDDSIAIIRPMRIIEIGEAPAPLPPPVTARAADVEPTPPAASPPAAPPRPATPVPPTPPMDLTALPADVETTLPSAPSPFRAQMTSAPVITTESAELRVDEVEALEEIEPDRESGPPSDQHAFPKKAARPDEESIEEIEPADEVDADRISAEELDHARTDEIPIVMEVEPEQPKRPPPPKKPTGPVSAPPGAPPASAAPPVSAPPSSAPAAPPPAPASKPVPPSSKAESKKRPWWEDVFSEDLLRTMDTPKLSFVQREVNFIEDSLGVEKGAVVLDLACGTGVHAVELASRGYSVVGFDLSLAMLARAADEAQERGQKLNFLQGDMREMAFEEMFDGIYCWSTSFGYFDEDKNLDVLARAHRALRHGGMLLIDIINRDFVAPRQPSLVWFEGDGCVCMDEMQVDFFTSRLKVKRTVMFEDGRTREIDYSIRLYNLHELGKMMHDCGFRVVQVTGHPAHPGVFFGSESPRIIVLAERAD